MIKIDLDKCLQQAVEKLLEVRKNRNGIANIRFAVPKCKCTNIVITLYSGCNKQHQPIIDLISIDSQGASPAEIEEEIQNLAWNLGTHTIIRAEYPRKIVQTEMELTRIVAYFGNRESKKPTPFRLPKRVTRNNKAIIAMGYGWISWEMTPSECMGKHMRDYYRAIDPSINRVGRRTTRMGMPVYAKWHNPEEGDDIKETIIDLPLAKINA